MVATLTLTTFAVSGLSYMRALAAGEAQQVEQADVDDERDEPDDAELGDLVHEVLDPSRTAHAAAGLRRSSALSHRTILPVRRVIGPRGMPPVSPVTDDVVAQPILDRLHVASAARYAMAEGRMSGLRGDATSSRGTAVSHVRHARSRRPRTRRSSG